MKFTDSHCHIYNEYYEDIESILNNSADLGVDRFINNACERKSIEEVLNLSEKYSNMYAAIGIYPDNCLTYTEDDINFIKDNINNPKVVAIGEIGLDNYYSKEHKKEQIELFEKQLSIAEAVDKPVIIHSREATQDTIDAIKKYKVRGVIHSFNGSLEVAKIYIKLGFALGVGGIITFKNCNLKDVIKEVGLENILLETDSPYLAPVPYRGKTNIPGYLSATAKFVSELYGVTTSELLKITNENVKRIFNI